MNEREDLFDDDDGLYELSDLANAADDAAQSRGPHSDGLRPFSHDQAGRMDSDIACVGCDYNLRGLLQTDNCPECGLAVSASLQSDRLRLADIGWLRSVKKGLLWLCIGTLGGIALAFVAGGFAVMYEMSNPSFNQPASSFGLTHSPLPVAIMEAAVNVLMSGCLIYAYWHLTAPEPNPIKPRTTRQIARWSAVPGYGLSIAASLVSIIQVDVALLFASLLEMASGLAVLVLFVSVMLYLRSLAKRIPSRSLAKQTSIVLWGLISCMLAAIPIIVLVVVLAANTASGPGGPGGAMAIAGVLLCPLGLGLLVFLVWWIVLMFVYHSQLGKVIASAKRHRRAVSLSPDEAHLAIDSLD